MKIKRHNLSKFSDLGTAVLYPVRTFHPEVQGENVTSPDIILEKSSTKTFLFSTELNSEYIDFAKYDFRFNLPETKYWSSLDVNQFSYENTVSKFGSEFDSVSKNIVPQRLFSEEKKDKHFFGRLLDSKNTIFLINIPSEIKTLSNTTFDSGYVWKVEFYNSRLTTNNTKISEVFIDYDVLSVLNPESIIEEPILSVYFGPSWDTQIQDYTIDDVPDEYYSRYTYRLIDNNKTCLTSDIYSSFTNYMSKTEYMKSVKEEVESEKMLYIVNTTDGDVETIDMFSAAYSESNLKYRNQNKKILRRDETKDYSILTTKGDMVFDSRSNTLLGIGGDINDCSFLRDKINQLPESVFSSSSNKGDVIISGKTYTHPKNVEILGENPEISPYWISPGDLHSSMFKHFYVTKSGNGKITPEGLVYLLGTKTLTIETTPDKGYKFDKIEDNKDYSRSGNIITPKIQNTGDRFKIIFKEIDYTFNLVLSCDSDYPNFGEFHSYQLSDLSDIDIDLLYYDYEIGDYKKYTGKKIEVKYTTPLKFKLDTSHSLYYTSNPDYFYLEDNSVSLNNFEEYTVLSIENTPQKILDNSKTISIIGALKSKQYTIFIETSKEIQVSTKKKLIFEYGDEVEIMFFGDKDINFTIVNEDTGELNSDEVWSKSIDEDGIVTLKIPKRTQDNKELGIKNNYKIIADI